MLQGKGWHGPKGWLPVWVNKSLWNTAMSTCVHLFEAAFMLQQQNWVFAAEVNGPYWSFPGGTVVKNPPASAGDTEDAGSVPGLGRSPGGGHGNPFQYSCLENPMDRERTLVGWSPWSHKVLWQTEQLNIHIYDLALQKEFADPCRRNQVSLRSNLKLWVALCSYWERGTQGSEVLGWAQNLHYFDCRFGLTKDRVLLRFKCKGSIPSTNL